MGDLIRACDDETQALLDAVRELPGNSGSTSFDWSYFLELIRHHGLTGILDFSFAPPDVVSEVEKWRTGLVYRNLKSTGVLLELVAQLQERGLQVMAYKGPVLGELAYGSLGKRRFVDLDLFLPREQIASAVAVLQAMGYVPRYTPSLAAFLKYHWEYPMVPSHPSGLHVELQWRWSSLRSSRRADEGWIWARPIEVALGSTQVLSPNIESYLLLLCQHGAGHRWRKLQWILDLVGLLSRHEVDWVRLIAAADRLECGKALALGLLLAQELGARLPDWKLLGDPVVLGEAKWIGRWVLPIRSDPHPLREKLFDWRLRHTLSSKFEYLRHLLFVPAHEDLATWPFEARALGLLPLWRLIHQVSRLGRKVAHRIGLPVSLPLSGKRLASNPAADLPEL